MGKKCEYIENEISEENINQIFCKSSESMDELPDNSIHLMVTSPPYNVDKEYDEDLDIDEYLNLLKSVWRETYRVLVPGGRVCINIANVGRKPYIPLHRYIIEDMQNIGYLMRGEIIWNKGMSAGSSTAWGSWMSASDPGLRDVHEYIMVFSKSLFSRDKAGKKDTIKDKEFLEWTKSVWTFDTVSASKVFHPAPFPNELPHRLIQLYSFEGDVILDPFAGSGTTCVAAVRDDRKYVGYDIKDKYIRLARDNLWKAESQAKWFNM
jgi:site-specific DNA-methyltransferase (adenine-specific)